MSADLDRFKGLKERMSAYYEAEKRGDWAAAYEFRSATFRRTVSKDRFLTRMQKDNDGWRLLRYQVKSSGERNGRVYLAMVFTEIPPSQYLKGRVPLDAKVGELEIEDESIWIREDNNWHVVSPGVRDRLALNAAVVQD